MRTNWIKSSIKNMETEAQIGLHPWERHPERPTRLLISVDMWASLTERADKIDFFLDYDPIRMAIRELKNKPHIDLLETIAEDIIEICFKNPKIEACKVEVLKPDIFNDTDSVGVQIYRCKDQNS